MRVPVPPDFVNTFRRSAHLKQALFVAPRQCYCINDMNQHKVSCNCVNDPPVCILAHMLETCQFGIINAPLLPYEAAVPICKEVLIHENCIKERKEELDESF